MAKAEGKITMEELSSSDSGVLPAVTVIRLLVNSKSSNAVRLVDHLDDIEKTEDWGIFQAVVAFIRDRCKIDEFAEEEILHALGVLSSNACNMAGFRARALFPVYSLINHSCAANARNIVNSEEGTVEVLAQRKIKKGEEICIRYSSQLLEPRHQRRSLLSSGWHFLCCCPRCADGSAEGSLAGLVCLQCSKSGTILPQKPLQPDSPWECRKCNSAITASEAESRVDKVAATLDRIPRNDVARLESFLKAAGRVLHPNHSVLLEVKRMLFSLYGSAPGFTQTELSEEQMARKLALGEEYIVAVSRVDPGLTKWRGQILYESNKIKLVRSLQALQTRQIGVEAFVKELTKTATELEEAVAGMLGTPVSPPKGLKDRLKVLSKVELLGPGYAHILGIVTGLPFVQ